MYALSTKRQRFAPRDTSVVVQALKLVLATVIAAGILTATAAAAFAGAFRARGLM